MRFGVLGPLTVETGAGIIPVNGRKQRLLLAVLLSRAGRPVSPAELVDALWGPDSPDAARTTLRWHAHRLRAVLGDADRLLAGPTGYVLHTTPGEIDRDRFEQLHRDGLAAQAEGDQAKAAELLTEALHLWRGPAYGEFADTEILRGSAVRLDELRLSALVARADAGLALGRHAELVTELAELVIEYPWTHRLAEQLMRALHRTGRTAEALDVYRDTRHRLVTELGIDPPESLRALHQRILRRDDETAPSTMDDKVARQLPSAPPGFTGRADTLAALDAETDGVVLLTGMAGVGKTATAVRWARETMRAEPGRFADGQLFADLRGHGDRAPMEPAEALGLFLSALGVPGVEIPTGLDGRVGRYRSLLAGRRMLVVLDNAGTAAQVRPLLPGDPACLTIVTSRDRLTGLVARDGAQGVPLDVLDAAESLALLRRVVGDRVDADPDAAATLTELCGGLPLALRIAAASLVERPRRTIAALNADLHEARLDSLAVDGDPESAVRTVFGHSYDALAEPVRRLFRLLGTVPGPHLTLGAAAALAGTDRRSAARSLARLASAHLLVPVGEDRYTMHDLLRQYSRELADEPEAFGRLREHYLHGAYDAHRLVRPKAVPPPPVDFDPAVAAEPFADSDAAQSWITAELPNLFAAVREPDDDGRGWRLMDALSGELYMRSNPADWAAILDELMPTAEPRAEGVLLHNRGLAARRAGDSGAAADFLGRALPSLRETGDRHREIDTLLYRAHSLADLGELDSAAATAAEARALAADFGNERMFVAALDTAAIMHWQAGDLRVAESVCREAVDFKRRTDATLIGVSLGNLSLILIDIGEFDEARDAATEGAASGAENGLTSVEMSNLDNLARVHVATGEFAAAVEAATRALTMARDMGAKRTEAWVLTTMAMADPARAESLAAEALRMAEEMSSPLVAADARILLSAAARGKGDVAAALDHAAGVVALTTERGLRIPRANALTVLAEAHLAAGDAAAATTAAAEAVALHERWGSRPGLARAESVLARAAG
ncbi:SARP family transcriptional regulator [Phytomonospora endophytica]|nr:SARP family transcriptional regulator [Phytomonospora endophytica]